MLNLDFCNTSTSQTSLLRLLRLPKNTNFSPIDIFHSFKNVITKLSSSRVQFLWNLVPKGVPKLNTHFSFWGSEHHFFGFHIHICLQSDLLRMSKAKALFLRPHGVLNCCQESIKSMVPHLIFKIFSKRSSTRFLKDVLSKSTTCGSNVRSKLNPKSCRQLQTASFAVRNQDCGWKWEASLLQTKISAENKKLRVNKPGLQC